MSACWRIRMGSLPNATGYRRRPLHWSCLRLSHRIHGAVKARHDLPMAFLRTFASLATFRKVTAYLCACHALYHLPCMERYSGKFFLVHVRHLW
jgi:hypothetical protein